jgi:hypothetical protein
MGFGFIYDVVAKLIVLGYDYVERMYGFRLEEDRMYGFRVERDLRMYELLASFLTVLTRCIASVIQILIANHFDASVGLSSINPGHRSPTPYDYL